MKTYKEKLEEVKQLNEGDIFYDDCGESYVFISVTKKNIKCNMCNTSYIKSIPIATFNTTDLTKSKQVFFESTNNVKVIHKNPKLVKCQKGWGEMDIFLSTMLEMKMIEAFGSEKFKKIEEEHDINVLVEYLTFYRYARTSVLETLLFQVKRIVEDFEDIEVSKIDDNEIENKFFYILLPKNRTTSSRIRRWSLLNGKEISILKGSNQEVVNNRYSLTRIIDFLYNEEDENIRRYIIKKVFSKIIE